jgi:hypothetical protein
MIEVVLLTCSVERHADPSHRRRNLEAFERRLYFPECYRGRLSLQMFGIDMLAALLAIESFPSLYGRNGSTPLGVQRITVPGENSPDTKFVSILADNQSGT